MTVNVLFVSVRNEARTHMATAWFNALVHPGKAHATSAGTQPAGSVDASIVDAMKEIGLDVSASSPRLLTLLVQSAADIVIIIAPPLPELAIAGTSPHDSWLLDEAVGRPVEGVRDVRSGTEKLVRRLLISRQWLPYGASSPPGA